MAQFIGMSLNNLIKHGNHGSAVVLADFLHLGIKLLSFVFIQLCPGFYKKLVEFIMAPMGIIPWGTGA